MRNVPMIRERFMTSDLLPFTGLDLPWTEDGNLPWPRSILLSTQ
jgi:hypothetical protein